VISLTPRERKTIQAILDARLPGVPRAVFGSRASGKAKRFSDLDLLLETERPLSPELRGMLREDFSESDLPFRVDLTDAATADAAFLALIERERIPLD